MIKSISGRITGFFIRTSVISEDDKEKYSFCFEVMLFDLSSFLTVILLAVTFGRLPETIVYLSVYSMLRLNTGGFHAKTHLRCYLTLCTTYTAFVVLLAAIPPAVYGIVCAVSVPFSIAAIYVLAPLEHANRILTPRESKSCKLKCRVFVLILSALILAGIVTIKEFQVYFVSGSLGMLVIALSLITAKIKNILRRNEHVKMGCP